MDNRSIKVNLDPNETNELKCIYSWYEEGKDNVVYVHRKKTMCFRMVLIDLYKDHIPFRNINIHPSILEEFREFESAHQEQIRLLKLEDPSNFTEDGFNVIPTFVRFADVDEPYDDFHPD